MNSIPTEYNDLSVVLTAATGSVIIVTTIVRWVTTSIRPVPRNFVIFRAKSQMVQKNSLMLNLAVSDLCLGETGVKQEILLSLQEISLLLQDLLLSLQKICSHCRRSRSHCKRSALTARDLLSQQEICSHSKISALTARDVTLTARDLLSLSLLQVVLGCPATLVQVCFPAWPLPDVSVLCQVNTQHTIRSQWFLE